MTVTSVAQFGQKVAGAVNASKRPAVTAAGNVAALAMKATAEVARTKGITVRKRNFVMSGTEAVSVKYGPNPGWVHIMDAPTQPHFIGARGRGKGSLRRQNLVTGRGRRSRRGARMALSALGGQTVAAGETGVINIKGGIGPKAYALHPGTKGKHFTRPGIEAGKRLAGPAFQRATHQQLARTFKGG